MWKLVLLIVLLCGGASLLVGIAASTIDGVYKAVGLPTLLVLLAIGLLYTYLRYRPSLKSA
jgi:hypothetical protein